MRKIFARKLVQSKKQRVIKENNDFYSERANRVSIIIIFGNSVSNAISEQKAKRHN